MVQQDVSDGEQIILEKPERGAKDGYLGSFFVASQQMNRVIAESNGISDHRIRLLTLKMIAGITDDRIRQDAFEYFDAKITEINSTSKSADEKNQEIANFCCGEMQGHIVAFYDQFIGITHRLKLGTI
jgi:hypothetical protein